MRYFIKISYLGGMYSGFQKNIPVHKYVLQDPDTIQGALECAFSTLLPKCIGWPKITVVSRTDKGVHALCSSAHIDIDNKYNHIYDPNVVLKQVNGYLGNGRHNIRLLEFLPVKENFHARHLVKSRTYFYRFMIPKNINEHRIPIMEKWHTVLFNIPNFDIERVKHGTQLFMGLKDFRTFSAMSNNTFNRISYVRKLNRLTIEKTIPFMPFDPLTQNFEYWNIICSAKSFLYNQVRRIASSLICLGAGKITEKDITTMLQVPNHRNWPSSIPVVPPYGLYLANVEYCQEEIDQYTLKYDVESPGREVATEVI